MGRFWIFLFAFLLATGTAQAASEWGVNGEKKARFNAKVVDILCELTGDCPADCGAGKRQLGLLRDDGTLVLAIKNAGAFTGAVADLAPFCGKAVVADGLLITNKGATFFALQFVRLAPDGVWSCANGFVRDWGKTHGETVKKCGFSEWFRKDPTIKAMITRDGKLGLGPENDPKE